MPLRAVFFDLDGTILDTALDLSAALNKTMIEEGLEPLAIDETRSIISAGSFALIKHGFGLDDESEAVAPLRQRLLNHYNADLSTHTEAFPGVYTLIEKLAENGIAWGIVTNKPWAYAEPLMARFKFASEPSCILSPEHVEKSKPAPDSLFLACEQTQCTVDEALYIGDHQRDIQCGINAGMPTIAVAYGYIPEGENIQDWNASHIADKVEDIWPLIQTYLN